MANSHGMAKGAAPLHGARIAVTRAGDRGAPLAVALAAAGATVHELPLTRIESLDTAPLAAALASPVPHDWIVLTSVNAVTHLAQVAQTADARLAHDVRTGRTRLAVVGAATAAAVESAGWSTPTVQPQLSHAEGLLDALSARSDVERARVLYPCAAGARDVLPEGLRALGAEVTVVPVYRSANDPDGQARMRALVADAALDLVTVAAPSAVDALLEALPPEHARRLPVACIGPVTARAARTAGFPVAVESTASTTEGFARAIIAVWPVHAMSPLGTPPVPRLP